MIVLSYCVLAVIKLFNFLSASSSFKNVNVSFANNWLMGFLTARQHRMVNVCQLQDRETGSGGSEWPTRYLKTWKVIDLVKKEL